MVLYQCSNGKWRDRDDGNLDKNTCCREYVQGKDARKKELAGNSGDRSVIIQ